MFKTIVEFIFGIFQNTVLFVIRLFVRRDSNFVGIGSWCGKRYVDNSRYLAEYIDANEKDIHIYWVGEKDIENDVKSHLRNCEFLQINRFRTNVKLLKCKYFFFSQMHSADISKCNVFQGAVLCYLHHGMPIKKWGQDGLNQRRKGFKSRITDVITDANRHYDYFVSSSPLHDKTNITSLSNRGCVMEKNIHSGTPRNDMFFSAPIDTDYYKSQYSRHLNFGMEKKVILYVPTFRRTKTDVFSFSKLDSSQSLLINDLLTTYKAIIIEKSHFAEKNINNKGRNGNIIFADSNLNIQEMMLFTDFLISDYSGAFLDYILLDRPVIHFAYDYDYYKNVDSGLYYDIKDFAAGRIVYTIDELICEIEQLLNNNDLYAEKRSYVREKYMAYEEGHASFQIVNRVIKGIHE